MKIFKNLENFKTIFIIQFIIFIPFLLQGFIGADWDSYASLSSGLLLVNDGLYRPSRPPGFPFMK